MKVKFSDKVKQQMPLDLLHDFVLLSYSVLPHQKIHLFTCQTTTDEKISITHTIPEISYQSIIEHKFHSEIPLASTSIFVFAGNDTIYICFADEIASTSKTGGRDAGYKPALLASA